MNRSNSPGTWIIQALLALIVIGLAVSGVMTYRILKSLDDDSPALRHSLPYAAIPVKFVMEDPVCADKLVRSMNITNVRILPRRGSIEASPIETIGLHCVDRECLQPI